MVCFVKHIPGDKFEVRLQVLPNVPLPTKPKIRVYGVVGSSESPSTAMRRFDHAPFFSMQMESYTIPFYVKNDKSETSTKEKNSWGNPSRSDLKHCRSNP